MSWVNDLDALASAGVISFDAPAYIRGTTPRYFGNPPLESIAGELPPIKQQPTKDEFSGNGTAVHNPSWKKWLFGGLVTGGIILGGCKAKGFLTKLFKKPSTPTSTKTISFGKQLLGKIKTVFTNIVDFCKKKFKIKP